MNIEVQCGNGQLACKRCKAIGEPRPRSIERRYSGLQMSYQATAWDPPWGWDLVQFNGFEFAVCADCAKFVAELLMPHLSEQAIQTDDERAAQEKQP